jgi:hypothetical protein
VLVDIVVNPMGMTPFGGVEIRNNKCFVLYLWEEIVHYDEDGRQMTFIKHHCQ